MLGLRLNHVSKRGPWNVSFYSVTVSVLSKNIDIEVSRSPAMMSNCEMIRGGGGGGGGGGIYQSPNKAPVMQSFDNSVVVSQN